ncbi:GIY-YIG nuclease superfamily protein [Vibrio phage 1.097.O._10N.286.49.B3]|uniref:GIY-YIG nuclease superfamily protein n=1 Tax=Vibrio phage 1.097.O._10N.286.49.B3 TaxID=1881383 RepID=A0A2I7R0R9_9CAUD|nr:GIY-YIG nuclease superfamily protein [Vibrio phage 1.097.O._10N.286.49.B3]AUR87215.1 GIY-YIG nuclease superfamily protein [Vibrio phage 1.097.O._10N.286.49.B3]
MSKYVYVIRLEDGCWYIGYTTDIKQRINLHLNTVSGPKWTKLHKPIEVVHIEECDGPEREVELTLELARRYGCAQVRGGAWTRHDCPVNLGTTECPIPEEATLFTLPAPEVYIKSCKLPYGIYKNKKACLK